ncbi:MAG: MarR family transcriptional regulator [Proteobacteria bacterium]|nr:MarR family transcriptional regulator [Pseudomonadota bacterium]
MNKQYFELPRLIERLHRRFIDVLKTELSRIGVRDINGVQALLLTNIGEEKITIRDLVERGYYLGSNVSYNIKKLTDLGYLDQEPTPHDRRSVTVGLTEKALRIVRSMREVQDQNAIAFSNHGAGPEDIDEICQRLRALERTWSDYINYGTEVV